MRGTRVPIAELFERCESNVPVLYWIAVRIWRGRPSSRFSLSGVSMPYTSVNRFSANWNSFSVISFLRASQIHLDQFKTAASDGARIRILPDASNAQRGGLLNHGGLRSQKISK
jgi:hypothetical protein